MSIIQFNKKAYLSHWVYLVKCVAGLIICYVLYKSFPQYPFNWALVSVVLAMSPDSNSTEQAIDRIKANILGCAVGICIYPLPFPELAILCIGVVITIVLGVTFKITNTLRSALSGLVIVTLQAEQNKHWYTAVERVVCVVTGCLVALLITLLLNWVVVVRRKK